jgi:hypothetical protein
MLKPGEALNVFFKDGTAIARIWVRFIPEKYPNDKTNCDQGSKTLISQGRDV